MIACRALLVCAGGGIGDTLLASLVARALRSKYATVDAVALSAHREVLVRNPDIDAVYSFDRPFRTIAAELRAKRYTAAVVTWATQRAAALPFAAGIPVRVGQARRLYSPLFTHRVTVLSELGDHSTHWSQILLNYARAIGCDTNDPQPSFPIRPEEEAQASALLAPVVGERRFAIVHPTCAVAPRRPVWPIDGWVSVVRALERQFGVAVLISGSVADRPIVDAIAAATGATSIAGKTALGVFAAVARRAQFFVVMHSGPMHIAAAVGTPTVGIFPLAVDEPERWGPLGPHTALVRNSFPCHCHARIETCSVYECVRELRVDEIVAAVTRLVERELVR